MNYHISVKVAAEISGYSLQYLLREVNISPSSPTSGASGIGISGGFSASILTQFAPVCGLIRKIRTNPHILILSNI
jgi:hypothetical protein